MFKRPVDGALYMYNNGFKVFPVSPRKKTPALKDWQQWARSATEKDIQDFGTANPGYNWGVLCGDGVGVIDIDNKPEKNKDGYASLKQLVSEHGKLPKTMTVLTPSDGKHIYYKADIKNSVSLLGQGIDTRGEGGYVVCPGSRSGNKAYEIDNPGPMADMPEWLSTQILQRKKDKIIIDEGAEVIEGERNNVLTSIAGTMREAGLSYEAILNALEVTNSERVNPPLPQHEIIQIAKSISSYKPGSVKASLDFEQSTPETFNTYLASDILPSTLPKRDWVMKGRYISRFISVLISRGGVGKSTLSMLDALAIATGRNLTGFEVIKPGGVWIYNTEDPSDELSRRMAAIAQHHDIPLDELQNVYLTSGRESPLLLAKSGKGGGVAVNRKAVDSVIKFIIDKEIKLFVLDPFVKIHAVNENDNMQVDKVVSLLNEIAERSGAAVSVIHHERKLGSRDTSNSGDSNRGRGASSLIDGVRVAHTVDSMTEKEAKKLGIYEDERRMYIRIDTAKSNMSAPAHSATWFKKCTVQLPNGDTVGSLMLMDNCMFDMASEDCPATLNAEKLDLVIALSEFLSPGGYMPMRDVADILLTDPKFSHLYGAAESANDRAFMKKVHNLFRKPIEYNNLRFSKDTRTVPGERNGRIAYIRCDDIEVDNMLE